MGVFMSIPFLPWVAGKDITQWVWHENAGVFNSDQTPTPPVTMSLWGGDFWGYIPPGAKTTQAVWGQQNRPGYGVSTMIGPRIHGGGSANDGVNAGVNVPGLPNDMLSSMIGGGEVAANTPLGRSWAKWGSTSMAPNTFAYINTPPGNAFLKDETQCTPYNFPKCSMTPMQRDSIIAWTPNQMSVENCSTDQNGMQSCPVSGDGTAMFTEFMATLQDLWIHYSTNQTEYLSQINEHDTSSWDPCKNAGTSVNTAIQIIFGVAFSVGLRVVQFIFIPESAELLDLPGNIALTVGPVAAGWFYAAHAMSATNDPDDKQLKLCASCLVYTATFIGAGFLGELSDNGGVAIAIGAGGGYALDAVANGVLVTMFKGTTFVPTLLLKILKWIAAKIVKGKCVLDYADTLMCLSPENADSDIQFKQVHSRRWDATSIAALLTDEALADMNITGANARESKQAEYVWKGLMYGVGIMTIGASGENGTAGTVFDNGTANPLGEITPINYGGAVAGSTWGNFWNQEASYSPWGQVYQPMGLGSWEGSSYQTGGLANWFANWGNTNFTSACNLYGCNNWSVIRNNTYGAHGSAMTAHISERLAAMKEALVKSYSDANYQLMLQIPGTADPNMAKTYDPRFQNTTPAMRSLLKGGITGLQIPLTDLQNTAAQTAPERRLLFPTNDPLKFYISQFYNTWNNAGHFSMDADTNAPNWNNATIQQQRCAALGYAPDKCVVQQISRDWLRSMLLIDYNQQLSPVQYADKIGKGLDDVTKSHYIHAAIAPTPFVPSRNAWAKQWLASEPDQATLQHLLSLSQSIIQRTE
jgi:hypothetical protein